MIVTIRVLIADDHAVVRQGIRALLEGHHELSVVGEAAGGREAVTQAQTLQPDVILLDLLMPDLNGVEVTRRLRTAGLRTRILILTSSMEHQFVADAIKAGADGYLLKASRVADLVQAIQQVARGQRVLDPAATEVLFEYLHQPDPLAELSSREREVFFELARGCSNPEIATTLSVSEATVRTHVANVLDKLMLRDRTQVTVYALKRGLIRLEELP
jgi:two-component system, NarL family, response regulator LiaR